MAGKLIRSKIAEKIASRGEGISIRTLGDIAYRDALFAKLREEVEEIIDSGGRDASEYGDLLQVMRSLAGISDLTWEEIERSRVEKKESLGGFDDRQFADFPDIRDAASIRKLIVAGDYARAFPTVYARVSIRDARRLSRALAQVAVAVPDNHPLPLVVIDSIIGSMWGAFVREYGRRDTDIHTRWLLNKVSCVSMEDFQGIPDLIETARNDGAGGFIMNKVSALCAEILPLAVILCGKREAGA